MTPEAAALEKTVLGLTELGLRLEWLRDQVARVPARALAGTLDQLCEASEAGASGAREVLLPLALLIVADGDSAAVGALRREAAVERLLSLDRLLRRPVLSHSAPPPADDVSEDPASRVPDYGAGRELTLGERRNLARRADRRAFDRLLGDPHPKVIAELLTNPKLVEDDVVRLIARRPARVGVLRIIGLSLRWMARARVRRALLLNPGTPLELSLPLTGLCSRPELSELVHAADVPRPLRALAREFLERRPPLATAERDEPLH